MKISVASQEKYPQRLVVPGDWRRPDHRATYEIVWEHAGKPGRLRPCPAPEEIAEAYDLDDYYTHGKTVAAAGRSGLFWRVLQRIAWSFDKSVEPNRSWWMVTLPRPPARVIDFGCGDGTLVRQLLELGHTAYGVDPDPDAIEAGARQGIEVSQGTAEEPPSHLKHTDFDAVIMSHSLEHCRDPQQALTNAFDLLRPGGTLVIEVPNCAAAGTTEFGPLWWWLDVPRHLTFFDGPSLEAYVANAGFKVVETVYRGYCRQFSFQWFSTQQTIAKQFNKGRGNEPWRYVRLLLRTIGAPASTKYDSVRVVARRPGAVTPDNSSI